MSKGMADYQLLGGPGGYGLEDSTAAAMSPYGHVTPETVGTSASAGSMPSMHSQGMGMLSQQPGTQSTYQQLGVPHAYPQSDMSAKYSHYGGYSTAAGIASNQYNSGARLHHLSDSMSMTTPQQTQMMTGSHITPGYQSMANNRYSAARTPQMSTGTMHHPAQSAAQYSPYTHTQSSQSVVNSSGSMTDMWSSSGSHSHVATQQAYMHPSAYPSQPQQAQAQLSPHTALTSVKNVQSQYGMATDDYVTHTNMSNLQQRKAAMYASQPSSNGPHLASGAPQPQQPQQTLSHIPVSQPDRQQAYSSQGPYGTNSQSIVSRPHYSTSSLQHGTTSSTAPGMSPQAMRPMQRLPYSSLHTQVNSGQASSLSQASRMPYCATYPSSQVYPVVSQQTNQSLNDTSTPPHMSPYQSSQVNVSAPASPQFRGGYPASAPQMAVSPRQPTSTPPAQGSPMPAASRTPDRMPNPPAAPTTPQSQGSYPSPGGARISSPGQVLSPSNTNNTPSSSLQQLEQMVMPSVKGNQLSTQHASQQPPTNNSLCTTNLMSGSYYSQQQPQQQSMASQSPHLGVSHAHPYYGQTTSGLAPTQQQPSVNRGSAYVPNSQNSMSSPVAPPQAVPTAMDTVQNSVSQSMSYGSGGPVGALKNLDVPSSPQMTSAGGVVGAMPPVVTPVVPTMSSPHHYQSNATPSYQNGASNTTGYSPHMPYQRMQYSAQAPSIPEEKKVPDTSERLHSLHPMGAVVPTTAMRTNSPMAPATDLYPMNSHYNPPGQYPSPAQEPSVPRNLYTPEETNEESGSQEPVYAELQPATQFHPPPKPTMPPPPQTQELSVPPPQQPPPPVSYMSEPMPMAPPPVPPVVHASAPVPQVPMPSPQPTTGPPHMMAEGPVVGQMPLAPPLDMEASMIGPPPQPECVPPVVDYGPSPPTDYGPPPPTDYGPPVGDYGPPPCGDYGLPPPPLGLPYDDTPPPKGRKGKTPKAKKQTKASKAAAEKARLISPPLMDGPPVLHEPQPNIEGDLSFGMMPPEVGEPIMDEKKQPKKSAKKKKAATGEPKEPKPKKPKRERKPKEPKKPRGKKAAAAAAAAAAAVVPAGASDPADDKENQEVKEEGLEVGDISVDGGVEEGMESVETDPSPEKKSKKKSVTPKDSKPKTPKKKLPKLALKFSKKKKRKRIGSSENSDIEKTPPPSPEDDNGKRRSARNTKRKKYTDDIDLALSEDDQLLELGIERPLRSNSGANEQKAVQVMNMNIEDNMMVDKILAVRTVQKELELDGSGGEETTEPKKEKIDVEEFYVKYKNLSYLHCEWVNAEELEKDKRVYQKIKRFRQKRETINNFFDFLEEESFNPDYIEVDRILDVSETVEYIEPDEAGFDVTESGETEKKDVVSEDVEGSGTKEKSETEIGESIEKAEDKAQVKDDLSTPKTTVDEDTVSSVPDETGAKTAVTKEEQPRPAVVKTEDGSNDVYKFSEEDDDFDSILDRKGKIPRLKPRTVRPVEEIKEEAKPDIPEEIENKENVEEKKEDVDVDVEENDETKEEEANEKEKEQEKEKEKEDLPMFDDKGRRIKRTKHYLVKWRALSYEESTWELEEDIDPEKVALFYKFRDAPPKEKWKVKKRPKPSDWVKIEESPVYKGGNTLREYQLEGLSWLTFCWYNGQNCILADEMGLGKTIQSLTYLNEIAKYGIPGPFLVIAPLSTIGNWQREFETWTDLNVITYHGGSASRNMIQEYEMYYKDEKGQRITDIYKFQVMITTFEIVLTDCLELREIQWRSCIIDEAHRLKNRNCKLLEGLRLINMEHRVLLTGTPLQNNVEELFSLLNFLEPNRFTSTETFLEEFGDLKTEGQVEKLQALLKPMMLRRLKEDVEKSLAPKEETIVEVELTNIQKKYYRAILERNFSFLTKGGTGTNVPNLMNTMMELRKCCIHPFLINGAEEQIIADYKVQHGETEDGGSLNALITASGKLVLIDKLLPRLRANGHRVLVFSQMVRCLDLLEDFLVQRRYPYERIDGRVRGNLRQAAIDRFCKPDSDRFVFLLCTRAGGLGINLTAADTVIIFDSDWNPQNDLQAQARCHRIGQSKSVKVYRLICRNTYEREMFDKASLKLGLDKAVLQSMNSSKENLGGVGSHQLSKKEIEDLLRKGAYGALMEDDNAGDKFCEEDIEHILQRRTHVITLEGGTKGSTFAKATFSSSNNCTDIEIDDPNFWEKWAKRANLDVDELKNKNELIVEEPRRRTQTRRFGADDHMLDLSELESSDEDEESISTRTRAGKSRTGGRGCLKDKTFAKGSRYNRRSIYDRERDEDLLEDIAPGNWTRAECFKVEKGLLTFGWGRWEEINALGNFRRPVSYLDIEDISRTVLLFCLQHYKGDEKIKGFIWDLITPCSDGELKVYKNHSGLSAPVPRGRKGKKLKKDAKPMFNSLDVWGEWAKEDKYNPDFLLNDDGYKKHLHRHANKVLLRVRLLYYLKHEVIGELHDQVFAGISANDILLPTPCADGEPPSPWWDEEADKSLLIGVHKHGYERFNVMRQDPALIFLSRCGPPDGAALLAELNVFDDFPLDVLQPYPRNEEELDEKGNIGKDGEDMKEYMKEDLDEEDPLSPSPSSSTITDPATPQPVPGTPSTSGVAEATNGTFPSNGNPSSNSIATNNSTPNVAVSDIIASSENISSNENPASDGNGNATSNGNPTAVEKPTMNSTTVSILNPASNGNPAFTANSTSNGTLIPPTVIGTVVPTLAETVEMGKLPFPSVTDMNTRLRRIITGYQRSFKKQELKNAQKARLFALALQRVERREKFEQAIRERELKKRELQQSAALTVPNSYVLVQDPLNSRIWWPFQSPAGVEVNKPSVDNRRWSRREEADFYRTISSFGVEFSKKDNKYEWKRFRAIARLDRKVDDTLTEYFKAFYTMCKRVCGKKLTEEEEQLPFVVEPISEERASRCLQKIDLLNKIREEILFHPHLGERLKLCQGSMDLPDWWINGQHDRDLLKGAAKYGLSRLDYHFPNDPELTFRDVLKKFNTRTDCLIINNLDNCSPPRLTKEILEPKTSIVQCKSEPGDSSATEESVPIGIPVLKDMKSDTNETEIDLSCPDAKSDLKPKDLKTEVGIKPDEEVGSETEFKKEKEGKENFDQNADKKQLLESDEKAESDKDKSVKEEFEKELPILSKEVSEPDAQPEEDGKAAKSEVDASVSESSDKAVPAKQEPLPEDDCDKTTSLKNEEEILKKDGSESASEELQKCADDLKEVVSQPEETMSQESLSLDTESAVGRLIGDTTMAQLLANTPSANTTISLQRGAIRWPKDKVLQIRLEHVCHAVEKNEWPVIRPSLLHNIPLLATTSSSNLLPSSVLTGERTFGASSGSSPPHPGSPSTPREGVSREPTPHATPEHNPSKDAPSVAAAALLELHAPGSSDLGARSSPVSVLGESGKSPRRRRRRRRFEIEAERAKLRAILSQTVQQQLQPNFMPPPSTTSLLRTSVRDDHGFEDQGPVSAISPKLSPSNVVVTTNSAPPPAHQNSAPRITTALGTLDLSVKALPSLPLPALSTSLPTAVTPSLTKSPELSVTTASTSGSPSSPMDLSSNSTPGAPVKLREGSPSASSSRRGRSASVSRSPKGGGESGRNTPTQNNSNNSNNNSSSANNNSNRGRGRARGGRFGAAGSGRSRIDDLALNLQAKKQQQMMEQKKFPADFLVSHHEVDLKEKLEKALALTREEAAKQSSEDEHPLPPVPPSSVASVPHRGLDLKSIPSMASMLARSISPAVSSASSLLGSPALAEELLNKKPRSAHDGHRSSRSKIPDLSSLSQKSGLGSLDHLSSRPSGRAPTVASTLASLQQTAAMRQDLKRWLDDHPELVATNPSLAMAMAFNPLPSVPLNTELLELPEGRRRGRRPRVDPTKLDFNHVTGEENVSVVNRLTGKKITGSKAPPLKHLAEWLEKNPMFDVDPKWGPLVKEKGSLPDPLQKRIITPSEKRGRRTAASLLAGVHGSVLGSSPGAYPSSTTASSTSGLNPLSFANAGLLAGFPSMKMFMDPPPSHKGPNSSGSTATTSSSTTSTSGSTPPIFLPFGGLAGMGLTNSLFGFPGFSFPGLSNPGPMGSGVGGLTSDHDHHHRSEKSGEKSSRNSEKSHRSSSSSRNKPNSLSASSLLSHGSTSGSTTNTTTSSLAGGIGPAASLPFLYPAPSLLYNPLGLGGFSLPPNIPASFATLAQAGLMNGLGGLGSAAATTASTTSSTGVSLTSTSSLSGSPLVTPLLSTMSTSVTPASTTSLTGSAMPRALTTTSSTPLSTSSFTSKASLPTLTAPSLMDPPDSDDESLKSLMENHDEDDDLDDLDDDKLDTAESLERDSDLDDGDPLSLSLSSKKGSSLSTSAANASAKSSKSEDKPESKGVESTSTNKTTEEKPA